MTLGPGSSQSRTASFLGRTLTLRQWRIEYEPDQQHVSRALMYTHFCCRTHIFLHCVAHIYTSSCVHIHAWLECLKKFVACMSCLSISPSPFSCFTCHPCCLLTVTSRPFQTLTSTTFLSSFTRPKARVKRTSTRAPRSLATSGQVRSPHR